MSPGRGNKPRSEASYLCSLSSETPSTFVCKVLFVRSTRFPTWALPVAGGMLFTIILGLWMTSAYWLFAMFGIGA